MTAGKLISIAIVLVALIAGGGMYYAQVYAYYDEVVPNGKTDVQLTTLENKRLETILYEDFRAIDSDSSPIRYRACFTTQTPLSELDATYEHYHGAEPRVAPGWFSCFDAKKIAEAIEQGRAHVFTGQRNISFGIDRVVAITDDGRGYVWEEINDCGDKAYDGTPLGDDCPPRDNGGT